MRSALRSRLVAGFGALALGACVPPATPPPAVPAPPLDAAALLTTRAAVEAQLAREVAAAKLPSLAFGLVSKSGLVYFVGLGERDGAGTRVTPDTAYRIGSITKTITGLALLKLRDAGRLDFDDPVARYVPELATARYPTRDSEPIRIRHLVTHTSGLPRMGKLDYGAWCEVTDGELRRAAAGAVLDFAPGTRSVYSNLGMALAGPVVERASGQSYRDYVNGNILGPLGMMRTVWDADQVPPSELAKAWVEDHGAFVPAGVHWRLGAAEAMGGLYSTVADMSRYVAFQLSAWPPRDAPEDGPVRRSSVRESQLVAGYGHPGNEGFGVNWIVRHDARLGHVVFHNGATEGYHAAVWMLPERGVGVVALGPRFDGIDGIAYRALQRAAGVDGRAPTMGEPARLAFGRVRALLQNPSRAAVERAFSPAFLKAIPADTIVMILDHTRDDAGVCTSARVLRADTPTHAEVELGCERSSLKVVLQASPNPPYLLDGLTLRPQ